MRLRARLRRGSITGHPKTLEPPPPRSRDRCGFCVVYSRCSRMRAHRRTRPVPPCGVAASGHPDAACRTAPSPRPIQRRPSSLVPVPVPSPYRLALPFSPGSPPPPPPPPSPSSPVPRLNALPDPPSVIAERNRRIPACSARHTDPSRPRPWHKRRLCCRGHALGIRAWR